jgi:energy-coupling factor transport system permease protein
MSSAAETAARVLSLGRRQSDGPLQRARATGVVAWCLALGLAIALFMNPLVLVAILVAVVITAWRCRVLPEVLLALAISLPLSLAIAMINPIASQQGLTVLLAGVRLPLVGTFDVTSEALIYGLVLGLRTSTLFALCALYVCCVSPDELLRVLRRHSVRSAITASLSVRFVPMLARDGANLAAARACRPGAPPSRATVVRAAFARSLERAGGSALALETRGFALARPLKIPPPTRRLEDFLLIASALLVTLLALAGQVTDVAAMTPYPTTEIAATTIDQAIALVIACCALLPVLVAPRGRS